MIREAGLVRPMSPKRKSTARKGFFTYAVPAAAAANVLLVAFVLSSLLAQTTPSNVVALFAGTDTVSAIALSALSVLLSTLLVLAAGVPAAFWFARANGRFASALENFIYLPIVFPPAVTGLALLTAFGRASPLGRILDSFGVTLPFTFAGVVLVQAFVTLPIFVQIARGGFAAVDPAVDESARVAGAGDGQLLFRIYLPIARPAVCAAAVMSALRAAGEFGATMMFAGSLAGRTQTMTTRVYALFQQDIGQAVCLAAVQLFLFILPLFLLKLRYREARGT